MESTTEKRKEQASKLLGELLAMHLEETQHLCNELGYKLEELNPVTIESFASKGVTSDMQAVRYAHHEERRIAKILKIASEVSKNSEASPNLKSLLNLSVKVKSSRNSSALSLRSDNFSMFSKPQDFINFGLEKEKEKFYDSLKTMERISFLRDAAKTQADIKRKQFEAKNKIVWQNRQKKKKEFSKVVESNEVRRKKILQKKYEILKDVDKVIAEHGVDLEKRMEKLADWQKVEIRKQYKKKLEKLRQRLEEKNRKAMAEEEKTKNDAVLAGELLEKISYKIDQRVLYYSSAMQTRVQSARNHSVKVDRTLQISMKFDTFNYTENLKKNVSKSLMSSQKREKKTLLASESSEKMKKMLRASFHNHKKGLSEISFEDSKRVEKIQERLREKQKLSDTIQKSIQKKYEENRQKNFVRMEKHFQAYIEKQRNEIIKKQKVLEKHQRIATIADGLTNYKNEVSANKRRSNLEIQRIRSSRASPSSKYSFISPRRFDKTL